MGYLLFFYLEVLKLGENGIHVEAGFRFGLFDTRNAKNTGFPYCFVMGFARRNFAGHEGLTTVFLGRRTILGGTVDFQIEISLRTQSERDGVGRRQRRRIPMRPAPTGLQGGLRGTGE